MKVLKGAQAHREHAGELLRTEASLLKRFDQLLLLHTQQKGAEDLRSKVREFTSQQAILMATMKTSRRVEDRVRVALALKVRVVGNALLTATCVVQGVLVVVSYLDLSFLHPNTFCSHGGGAEY